MELSALTGESPKAIVEKWNVFLNSSNEERSTATLRHVGKLAVIAGVEAAGVADLYSSLPRYFFNRAASSAQNEMVVSLACRSVSSEVLGLRRAHRTRSTRTANFL